MGEGPIRESGLVIASEASENFIASDRACRYAPTINGKLCFENQAIVYIFTPS